MLICGDIKMIVPNKGDKVVLMRIGKFTLYSVISKVNAYMEASKTWEVEVWNGNKNGSDLKFKNVHEPDYHFDTIPVKLINKSYDGNDWELAEGQR